MIDDVIGQFSQLDLSHFGDKLWDEYARTIGECPDFAGFRSFDHFYCFPPDVEPWLMKEFFLVFHKWLRHLYEHVDYTWETLPSFYRRRIFENEQQVISRYFENFMRYLWERERGREMYPEERHHLCAFLEEYYEYIEHKLCNY